MLFIQLPNFRLGELPNVMVKPGLWASRPEGLDASGCGLRRSHCVLCFLKNDQLGKLCFQYMKDSFQSKLYGIENYIFDINNMRCRYSTSSCSVLVLHLRIGSCFRKMCRDPKTLKWQFLPTPLVKMLHFIMGPPSIYTWVPNCRGTPKAAL